MKLKFTQTKEIIEDGKTITYEAGKVYEFDRPDSIERWKRRGAVEYVEEQIPLEMEEVKEPKKKSKKSKKLENKEE